MPSDKDLVSEEKHEIDYLLRKWEKAQSKKNRDTLIENLRAFKADDDYKPHNRARFYEYVEEKGVKDLLDDKTIAEEPAMTMVDESFEEPPMTITDEDSEEVQKTVVDEEDEEEVQKTVVEEEEEEVQKTMMEEEEEEPVTLVEEEESPATVMEEAPEDSAKTVVADEEESARTVVGEAGPPQKKKSKLVPILIICGIVLVIAIGVILFLLVFRPADQGERAVAQDAATASEEETTAEEVNTAVVEEEPVAEAAAEESTLYTKESLESVIQEQGPLYFKGDKAELNEGEKSKLDNIISYLGNYKKVQLLIEGHTANVDLPSHEMSLSKQRAQAIKDYLEAQLNNIDVEVKAYGAQNMVVKNVPIPRQQKNRRVEILVEQVE